MYRHPRHRDVHLWTVRARGVDYDEYAFLSAALHFLAAAVSHQSLVNTSRQKWFLMTTLQMAIPVAAAALDTPEAQEARWIAWKSKGAAADRITQQRTRIAFTTILIALACVTLAVML
jgi:hypothetical protein